MYSLTDLYDELVSLMSPSNIKSGITYLGITGNYVDSTPGYAIDLNGSYYLSIGNLPNLQSSVSNITVSFWANPNILNDNAIVSSQPDDDLNRLLIHLPNSSTYYWDVGNLFTTGRLLGVFNPNWSEEMAMWTFVSEPAGQKVYRNSVLIASDGSGGTFNKTGKEINLFENYVGKIDELLIFNRPLSLSEIQSLYNSGYGLYGDINISPFSNGLVAGYHFDNEILDFSGNNNNTTSIIVKTCSQNSQNSCESINGCTWTNESSSDYYCTGIPSGTINYTDGLVPLP